MELARLLSTQGFGSRAQCRALVAAGGVTVAGQDCTDPWAEFSTDGLVFVVNGEAWRYRRFAYLALNKPEGYECSQRPSHHPSVYSLLPAPIVTRGVQAVGRLDQDTTGLLLFSDDGQFIHACTSPRKQVAKEYLVTTRHMVDDRQLADLVRGVALHGEVSPVAATACVRLNERCLRLTVTLGKYHLVKRMLAAVGNRVEQLQRVRIGGFVLPSNLGSGGWQWLEEEQVATILSGG